MKIKEGFVMRKVGGSFVAVPVLARAKEFNGQIRMNETGAFLFEKLASERSAEELTALLAAEYGLDAADADTDVSEFLKALEDNGLLEKT